MILSTTFNDSFIVFIFLTKKIDFKYFIGEAIMVQYYAMLIIESYHFYQLLYFNQ